MATSRRHGLPGHYYTDPKVFAAELESVFARTWQLVGHRSQVGEPGRLMTASIGDESVVVANDDGELVAFYNVCQHRGHELVAGETARSSTITCPYHAWTYDLGGRLLHARGEDVGEICVPRVEVATLAGFCFVNLDPDAPSLADTVPGLEAELLELAPDAPERVLTTELSHEIPANWKLAVENYNECFHCPNVHKSFTTGVVSPGSYRIAPRGSWIHHRALAPEAERSASSRSDAADDYGSFFTWPVSSIQCYPGRVLNTFRWVPVAPDRTRLIRQWWFDRDEPTQDQRAIIDLDWTTTVAEDIDLMTSVQKGMSSRGYRPGPLIEHPSGVADVHTENPVVHLHSLLHAALGDG